MALIYPACRVPTASYEQAGVSLDLCQACRGLWFDAGELAKVAPTPVETGRATEPTLRLRDRYCPRCPRQRLEQAEVQGAPGIRLDRCDRCSGVFVEAGRLQRIERLKTQRLRRATAEDARLRRAWAEEKEAQRRRLATVGGGVEIERPGASDNFLAFVLGVPWEEDSSTETTSGAVYGLMLVITLVWLWQVFAVPESFWLKFAVVPSEILAGAHRYTLLTAVFLHGGWDHVLGNLYFLWLFGRKVEDRLGHLAFAGAYLAWGLLASVAAVTFCSPGHRGIPELGASGAIAGVMGAYFVFFPRGRIATRLMFSVVKVPASTYLGFWAVLQAYSAAQGTPGVGWWAHIGGFGAGVLGAAAHRWWSTSCRTLAPGRAPLPS